MDTGDPDIFCDDEEVVATIAGEGVADLIVQESNFPGFKDCIQDMGDVVFALVIAGEHDSFSVGEPVEEVLDFLGGEGFFGVVEDDDMGV